VVLPGLDTDLDDEAWQSIGGVRDAQGKFTQPPASNHPQFAMHALLHRLGIRRGDVEILGAPAAHGRDILVSEAMRPSNATAQWHRRLAHPDIADKISLWHEKSRDHRGRQSRDGGSWRSRSRCARRGIFDKTAALVTPDRALARRVMAALGRWNLVFDDSGGDALMDTSAGSFRPARGGGRWQNSWSRRRCWRS
jgi:ATP-dependent helicase/nuclease subunit B